VKEELAVATKRTSCPKKKGTRCHLPTWCAFSFFSFLGRSRFEPTRGLLSDDASLSFADSFCVIFIHERLAYVGGFLSTFVFWVERQARAALHPSSQVRASCCMHAHFVAFWTLQGSKGEFDEATHNEIFHSGLGRYFILKLFLIWLSTMNSFPCVEPREYTRDCTICTVHHSM
ncbi:hypothetical protein CEXT_804121, partial [Caerostris extrusa]